MKIWQYAIDVMFGAEYQKLFKYLDEVIYTSDKPFDDNVIEYGRDVTKNVEGRETEDVTVLAVLVGLAIKIENDLMYDESAGDRTSEWFWKMINNLSIDYDDEHWNKNREEQIDTAIDIWVNRRYNRDGSGGGLFTIKSRLYDMKKESIWMQANHWVDEAYGYEYKD